MRKTFRSLRFRNFRLWFIGGLVSNAGTWMQTTAVSWVLLTELTDGNATLVGVALALQYAPPMLLLPAIGWLADRVDRRTALLAMQSLLLTQAVVSGVLLLTDTMTIPLMLVLVGFYGLVSAFEIPVRQAFITDLVPLDLASNAVALNSASFNTARLVGPAIAGLLLTVLDSGWVFVINATTFLAALTSLLLMRMADIDPDPERPAAGTRVLEGLRYVGDRKDLTVLFICMFALSAFTVNLPMIIANMSVMFEVEASGFGLVNSVLAVGSLAGALLAAHRAQSTLRALSVGFLIIASVSFVSSLAPSFASYLVVMAPMGFASVFVLATSNAYTQATTARHLRGRVLAVYFAMLMAGSAVGAPIVGLIVDTWGARSAVVTGSVVALLAFVAATTFIAIQRRRTARVDPLTESE